MLQKHILNFPPRPQEFELFICNENYLQSKFSRFLNFLKILKILKFCSFQTFESEKVEKVLLKKDFLNRNITLRFAQIPGNRGTFIFFGWTDRFGKRNSWRIICCRQSPTTHRRRFRRVGDFQTRKTVDGRRILDRMVRPFWRPS